MSVTYAPSPEQFAQTVAEAYVNGRELEGDVVFDREKFQLIIKDAAGRISEQIFLGHFFNEYCAADPAGRELILARATGQPAHAQRSKEDYLSRLVPQIKDRWSVEKLRMSLAGKETRPTASPPVTQVSGQTQQKPSGEIAKPTGKGASSVANDLPHLAVSEHLSVLAAYDLPQQIAYASRNQLADLGLTFEQALALAKANLSRYTKTPFDFQVKKDSESNAVLAYESAWQDNYDAARMLCSNEILSLAVEGEHVLFPLSVNRLLVTGSKNTRGLAYALSAMTEAQKGERPLPPFALVLRADGLHKFQVRTDSPLGAMFRELEATYLFNLHAWQRQLLQEDYTIMVEGIQVAKYDLVTDAQTGRLLSSTTIECELAPVLVPEVDLVSFIAASGKVYKLSWVQFTQATGQSLVKTPHYPHRYQLEQLPAESELASWLE